VIIGKSGVGKSTLVKFLIGGLKPGKKTIYYKMDDLATLTDEEIQAYRKKIGIVFQDDKLISSLSLKENILYPLRLLGLEERLIKSKYAAIVESMQLDDIMHLTTKTISGGEKQKVAIARALIHDPDFIIADEPTGNLDWEYTQEIGNQLLQANKNGTTIMLITHDIHLLNYIKTQRKVNIFQM
jgi:cell division transport system ATP-binding protein